MKNLLLLSMIVCLLCPLQLQAQRISPNKSDSLTPPLSVDSISLSDIKNNATQFRGTKLIAPAALVTIGTIGLTVPKCREWNRNWRDKMATWRNGHYFHADDYLQYVPSVAHLGLSLLGAKASHTYLERICVLATSYATMGILVNTVKYTVRERRPDGSSRNSFPSGHTATVFMGAELVRLEYKDDSPWYGIGAYTIACGVGFLRTYNNRHWVSDVIAGAGIGILSANIGYWLLPLERKWFGLDKKKNKKHTNVLVCPYYDNYNRGAGALLTATF